MCNIIRRTISFLNRPSAPTILLPYLAASSALAFAWLVLVRVTVVGNAFTHHDVFFLAFTIALAALCAIGSMVLLDAGIVRYYHWRELRSRRVARRA